MAKRRGKNEAMYLNQKTINYYNTKLKLLAMNCFEWEGLPNEIPQRFIENTLYHQGILAFVDDPIMGIICCSCNMSGQPNLYNEGVRYNLYANNGYNEKFDRDDIVLVRNNKLEIPTMMFTDYYIKKFFEIDRTIDVNVIQQKTSRIIQCQESEKLSLENLMMQYEGNVPFIFAYKNLDVDGLKAIELKEHFVADKLQALKGDIWSEFLETLGINNANTNKKERLITDEVNANNQLISISSDVFLESRQLACEQLNEKFGLNVTVKRRYEEENGGIYSNTETID